MRKILVMCLFMLLSSQLFASSNTDDKTLLKNVWKIEQIYYDSIPASIDTVLVKFRFIPAADSVFYLHDGKTPKMMFWNLEDGGKKISVYQTRDLIGGTPFVTYKINYIDDQNLILVLDISNRNLGVAQIEYRLIPDPDFFN